MFELSLLCPEDRVEDVSEALDALDALSVSVEDADAHTEHEQALFGEPGMPAPREGWQRSRVVALFAEQNQAEQASALLQVQDFFQGCAVVGVQPFGGHGLSGTGPKAGGSFYLQRLSAGAPWQMPPLSKTGEADEAALQTMASLLAQMGFGHDAKVRLSAVLGESRVHTLRQAEMPLPGPTGERNSLSWHAPQRVWLYGGDLETAFAALIRLAASGIRVQVLPVHPLAIWQEHAGQWLEVSETPFAGASHVVALENLPANIKMQLSAQRGALVKVLLMPDGVDVLPLFDEISRSVNTTAAGGNASLMAMAEG